MKGSTIIFLIIGMLSLFSIGFVSAISAPTDFRSSVISLNEVNLVAHNTASDLAGFKIFRSTNPTTGFVLAKNLPLNGIPADNDVSYVDTFSFVSGTIYYYRISAYNSTTSSSNLTGNVTIPFPPNAPSNININKVFAQEIDINWTDNSNNEDGFNIERATSSSGPWIILANIGPNYTFYPATNLNPSTNYYFRVRSFNTISASNYINISGITSASVSKPDATGTWLVVITNRGTALPSAAVNSICDLANTSGILYNVANWIKRESNKYNVSRPFTNITCLTQQISVPNNLWNGDMIFTEGQWIQEPLNQSAVINFLESDSSLSASVRGNVSDAKFVSIVHYMPTFLNFADNAPDNKYSFLYLTPLPSGADPSTAIDFYPTLNVAEHGRLFAHEFMHNINAIDKYGNSTQACQIDSSTGQEYAGYDIMCHRIRETTIGGSLGGGFFFPSSTELIVSIPTANESGWLASTNNYHPADKNTDNKINNTEIAGYNFCWKTFGCTTYGGPISTSFVSNANFIWKSRFDSLYHYVGGSCPACYVSG